MRAPVTATRQRDSGHYRGAGARMALDLELSAEHAHPLFHPCEADPLTRPAAQYLGRGRVETPSEIVDLQANLAVQQPQPDAHPPRARVLAYVRQALLR